MPLASAARKETEARLRLARHCVRTCKGAPMNTANDKNNTLLLQQHQENLLQTRMGGQGRIRIM